MKRRGTDSKEGKRVSAMEKMAVQRFSLLFLGRLFGGWKTAFLRERLSNLRDAEKQMSRNLTNLAAMRKEELMELAHRELGMPTEEAHRLTKAELAHEIRVARKAALEADERFALPAGFTKMRKNELKLLMETRKMPTENLTVPEMMKAIRLWTDAANHYKRVPSQAEVESFNAEFRESQRGSRGGASASSQRSPEEPGAEGPGTE